VYKEVAGKVLNKITGCRSGSDNRHPGKECIDLNKRFFSRFIKISPYIILKWAQSSNGKIAGESVCLYLQHKQGLLVKELSLAMITATGFVHKWREGRSSNFSRHQHCNTG